MRQLLAVSWAMPPMLYPRSIQVARILSVLSRMEWQSTVICNDPLDSGASDASLALLYDANYRKLSVLADVSQPMDALISMWRQPALQAARAELSASQYAALVTFAQPWVDHVIGLELHRESSLPWIAHFSDPWVDNPYYVSTDPKQLREWKRLEHEVIRQATAVVFTNTHALDLVMRKYPSGWRRKAHVIPHTFDAELARSIQGKRPAGDHRLRMIYTGDLYAERSAAGLFKALQILSRKRPLADELNIQFMGRIMPGVRDTAKESGLRDVVDFHDQLPYLQSLRAIATCDVLLLIDAPSLRPGPFLPSKLVDYLVFGKPILGLVPREGASADLLRRLGTVIVAPDDIPSVARGIEDLLSQWQTGNLKPSAAFDEVAFDYHPESVGLLWDHVLSRASETVPERSWWQSIWIR